MNRSLLALAIVMAVVPYAHADEAGTPATNTATELDAVSVIGSGELRQVQRITPENLEVLPPGTSPQKILNLLPGVNAQSVDALGTNEQSMTLSLRGFTGSKLGYTLDGLPLGDGAYNNYNGLSINRALISENLGMAELAQGIGNLSTPSSSNLGGAIGYFSNAPLQQMGARVSQSFGSDGNRRSFARFDSGQHNGFSMYVSGMYATSDLWNEQTAYNQSTTRQFNTKAVYENDWMRLTGFADASRTSQANDFYLSKDAMKRGLGWDWGGYAPNWDKAVAKAYCNKNTYVAARCDNSGPDTDADGAFTAGQILRNDDLYYASAEFFPNDDVTLKVLGYHHEDQGEGHNWNSGAWSNKGTAKQLPIIFRNTLYSIDRSGGTVGVEWRLGAHHVQAGGWYERNTSSASRYQSAVDGPRDFSGLAKGQPDTGVFAQETHWTTQQLYLQDTLSLMDDRLRVEAGFKTLNARSDARALAGIAKTPISPSSNNQFATGSLRAKDSFLPSAGVYFQLDPRQELFASYAKNIAMFQGGFKLGPQAVSQATWNRQGALQPEKSRTFEVGYRWIGDSLQISLAGYDVRFDNRLLQYNPCDSRQPVGPTCGNRFYNVGSVTSRGAELTALWSATDALSWYNAASYNDSTYDSDYTQNGVTVPTKGKTQADTPELLLSSELRWYAGPWSAQLRGKYTGKRYYTYTNDQGFGCYTTFDTGAAYDFGKVGMLQKIKLSLNVANLTDKRYASNLDSSVFAATDPDGKLYVFHASAPRQVFATLDARF